MKLTRRLGAAAVALALGAGLSLGVGSANAAAPVATTTTITLQNFSGAGFHYGDYVSVQADVTQADGTSAYDGSVAIQARPVGGAAWTTVDTEPYAGAYYSFQVTQPMEFQAVYSGYTGTSSYETSFSPSTSTVASIASVGRGEMTVKDTKKKYCVKVGPKPYKNKPIYHYVKVGKSKKWKKSYTERTNKKSQICYKVVHTKVKKHKLPKGPKLKAVKTVYVKSGGMKKQSIVQKF